MQFYSRRKKLIGNAQTEQLYGHCLQFYGQPPIENISLSEFETFAVDRLKRKLFRYLKLLLVYTCIVMN